MKAVVLAGGKGRRLQPYTTNFPKPLMPIGERPILEIVLGSLRDHGVRDVIIATGHLEELIRAYFGSGERFGLNIKYSKEEEPLGTAGPLDALRDDLDGTFLMMNGDVLTDLSFSRLLTYHRSHGQMATVATCERSVQIEFGVVEVDQESRFKTWTEKPELKYLVSMGIYVFEREALNYVPKSSFFNLPDLVQRLDGDGKQVACYQHGGYWLDIGRPADYEKACADYGGDVA